MVKRRNSPYQSHDRKSPIRVEIDCTPHPLEPLPVSSWQWFPSEDNA
jgi:hypothetical protein